MINLIYKDLLLSRKYLLAALIFMITPMYMGANTDNIYIQSIIIIFTSFVLTYIILNSTMTKDERNKSELVLNSLPINRSHIIIAKYLNILLISALIWVMEFSVNMIFFKLNIGIHRFYVETLYFYITILFAILYFSIYYPLYFKLGSLKLRMFNTIVYLFIILLPTMVSKFHDSYLIKSIISAFSRIDNIYSMIYLLLGFSIILFLLSMTLSIKIYLKKEF